ncbi:ArsR/SmtB family transcription factor [Paractinoplanes lichenicola]|uniref:Helix-turn-helix transcriptional regulator n=1 Tax=Paractinoplanes lichenicola TaxID=2802976 RepID=A0ABS1VM60_9ACTN|nr:helix-turn-helix domain-containing protein [Actinoplanes lichenicola]MBL7255688.1 helix-turn-helix transcriptional regulator [Actinoplanes lichenicola]
MKAAVDVLVGDVSRLPVAVSVSPLSTTMTSVVEAFGVLRGRLPSAVQAAIHSLARPLDLSALAPIGNRHDPRIPDALHPGRPGTMTFAEELELIGEAGGDIRTAIADEFTGDVPEHFRSWLDAPARALGAYVDTLRRYHDLVVRRVYPDLFGRLRREAELLEGALVDGPTRRLLERLHPSLSIGPDRLRHEPRSPGGASRQLRARSLTLVPVVSAPLTYSANLTGALTTTGGVRFSYAPPNLALFDNEARPRGRDDPLAALLGPRPTVILRRLARAATTSELADELGLAPSTVSHHLTVLLAGDTVSAHRQGNTVYYRLTDRGRALLELYP